MLGAGPADGGRRPARWLHPQVGSLHDERYRDLAGPDAKFEPTLIRTDGDAVVTSTGLRLAIDLVKIIGMRRAYRVALLVRAVAADASFDPSRRNFLVKAASVAAIVPFAPLLADMPAKALPRPGTLTIGEAGRAYKLLRASSQFKATHRIAKADGVRHRRDRSPLTANLDTDGFKTDTYTVFLASGDDRRRLLTFLLTLQGRRDEEQVVGRWMSALVDIGNNEVLSALDVDASEVHAGAPAAVHGQTPGDARLTAEMRGQLGSARLPGGRLQIREAGTDITLDEGRWYGHHPPADSSPTRDHISEIVCIVITSLHCGMYCAALVAAGIVGGILCGIVCTIVYGVLCVLVTS